jgi:glycosyltransferase involved in cell wall biosynthesis
MSPSEPLDYTPLSEPLVITKQSWPAGTKPVVTICCATYNHEQFIAQALESFLMQETTFPVEILVRDDASTDGTANILRDYQSRYPSLIRAILETENQYSKGIRGGVILITNADGKFIACCEGDDFWVDSLKLQRQVDHLRSHPKAMGCFTDCQILTDDRAEPRHHELWRGSYHSSSYDQFTCLTSLHSGYATATLMFDSVVLENGFPNYYLEAASDFLLDLIITEEGTLDYLPGTTAVYRRHSGGVWSGNLPSANCMISLKRIAALGRSPEMWGRYRGELVDLWRRFLNEYRHALGREGREAGTIAVRVGAAFAQLDAGHFQQVSEEMSVTALREQWESLAASGKNSLQRLHWLAAAGWQEGDDRQALRLKLLFLTDLISRSFQRRSRVILRALSIHARASRH